ARQDDDRLCRETLDLRPAVDRELEPAEIARRRVRVRDGDQTERPALGVDEERRAPVRAELLANDRIDPREELGSLERRAERLRDVEQRGGRPRLGDEA